MYRLRLPSLVLLLLYLCLLRLPSALSLPQALGKRARKKVHSIMLKEEVVDHGVKSVSSVVRSSGVADDD